MSTRSRAGLLWALVVPGALLLLGGGLYWYAGKLPPTWKIERSIVINKPAERVFPLLAEPRNWQFWHAWNRREAKVRMEYSGAILGPGARWSWHADNLPAAQIEVVRLEVNRAFHYRMTFLDSGAVSRGSLLLRPGEAGVQLIWTSEGDFGPNRLRRYFGAALQTQHADDIAASLANLKQLAEAR